MSSSPNVAEMFGDISLPTEEGIREGDEDRSTRLMRRFEAKETGVAVNDTSSLCDVQQ